MYPNARTIQLWRRCLRCCKAMENGAMGNYYQGFAREHIVAHREEADPTRLEHLHGKGEQNLRFVLRKYRMTEPRPPEPRTASVPQRRSAKRRGGAASSSGTENKDSESVWTPGQR